LADATRVRTIHHHRRISAVAPKLVGTASVNGRQALAIGVVFRQERGIKSWWELEGRVADRPDEVMLGADAARDLGLRVGDLVEIGGSPTERATVVGVIALSGSVEDRAILADIGVVQQALGRDQAISFIEISALCKGCPIDEIVAQIAAVLPDARVSPIRQAVAARERAVLQFTRFGYAVSAVVLLVGVLVVLTTTLSAVTERTQELGILRAVGFRRWQIARVVLFETVAAAAAGGLAGWLLGTAAARFSGPALAQLTEPVPADWSLAVVALGLSVLIGAGGGIYPALRATRMDPALALRHF
jgi:putative ABC transport system permease protein